jgi:hypothetical protein
VARPGLTVIDRKSIEALNCQAPKSMNKAPDASTKKGSDTLSRKSMIAMNAETSARAPKTRKGDQNKAHPNWERNATV